MDRIQLLIMQYPTTLAIVAIAAFYAIVYGVRIGMRSGDDERAFDRTFHQSLVVFFFCALAFSVLSAASVHDVTVTRRISVGFMTSVFAAVIFLLAMCTGATWLRIRDELARIDRQDHDEHF